MACKLCLFADRNKAFLSSDSDESHVRDAAAAGSICDWTSSRLEVCIICGPIVGGFDGGRGAVAIDNCLLGKVSNTMDGLYETRTGPLPPLTV